MSDLTSLEQVIDDALTSKGDIDFLGANQSGFPHELQFFRDNVRTQIEHILNTIISYLVVIIADTLSNSEGNKTITLFQNNEWDEGFLKGLNQRLGSIFMMKHFIGGSGIGSRLLEYMKEHKIMLLRKNVELRYTENDSLIAHKLAESPSLEPPRNPTNSEVIDLYSLK